jgi:Zn-dependent M28 family amino/carboxypeptidase
MVGIVTAYPSWTRDAVLRPTLIDPTDIHIPAIGTTQAVGQALADAAATGASVHIETQTSTETRSSMNVIAETPWGDPAHVVMLGGHLDSVVDGPGMNDNGSGTMTVLEIARELGSATGTGAGGSAGGSAGPAPAWKVRVAFWTGEEIGLWGSRAYVQGLGDRESVEAYLNFDMLGSPNGVRLVYDGSATSRPTEGRIIAGLFSQAFDSAGLVWQSAALGGSSDHFPFDQAGIPTGGLFSGANERKTAAQAELFGGDADTPDDSCYHLACDTTDNVDSTLLGDMARAAAWVTGALASGDVDLGSS